MGTFIFAGLVMGVAMMITTGFLTNYSVRLIVRLGLQHDANSYPQLLEKAYKVRCERRRGTHARESIAY